MRERLTKNQLLKEYSGKEHRAADGRMVPSRDVVWDEVCSGLALRTYPSGRKSWVLGYRLKGRWRLTTIGPADLLSPTGARERANRLKLGLLDGIDPAEKRAEVVKKRPTLRDAWQRFEEEHLARKKPSSIRNDRSMWTANLEPALGSKEVAEIARVDVSTLLHQLRSTPTRANRVIALLSKILNLCEVWGWRPDGSNPTRHVEKFKERKRERVLSDGELNRLGAALRDLEASGEISSSAAGAIRTAMLTGLRIGEVLALRWSDLDLERGAAELRDSKTGARRAVLGAAAVELLGGLDRSSEWVFPGARIGAPLVNIAKPWARVCSRAGIEGCRIHDLRHGFASAAVGDGASLPIVGKLLGHSQPSTTARYGHVTDDPARAAADTTAKRIADSLKSK